MKKLIALIGAVAMSFGLFAEDATPADYYANSFETTTEGASSDGLTWSPTAQWSTTLTDAFNLGDYTGSEPAGVYGQGAQRRDGSDGQDCKFENTTTNAKFLKLETGTNTLDCATDGLDMSQGKFYFDQLVKFTGFEEAPTFAADTKIAVWMSAIEQEGTPAVPGNGEPEFIDDLDKPLDEGGYEQKPNPDYFAGTPASDDYIAGETNLYVQVGTGTESVSVQIDPASVGETEFAVDKWYRITIKSIGNVVAESGHDVTSQLGFLVFINGKQAAIVDAPDYHSDKAVLGAGAAAKYYAAGQLFTAIDTTTVALAKVGYQGIGAIDDVVLSASSPDFDMSDEIEVEIGSFALTGAKVIKIGDVTITDQTSIKVKPGDILVSYAANGPYIVRNGENVKWTFEDGQFVRVKEASTIEIIPAAAVLNKTDYKAADELYGLLVTTGLENGDNLEFLTGVAIKESEQAESSVYEFSAGTKIDVTIENNVTTWMIESVSPGDLVTDNAGAAAGFAKYYTLADEGSSVILAGEVAGLIQADYLDVGNGVTITGEGKVITLSGELEIYDGENLITPKYDEATGYYTYALATEPTPTPTPTTGFAIIIADAEAGTSTTNYYETLDAAIAAAGTTVGDVTLPSVVTILENVTIENTVLISKAVTLDATGKTVTCAAMYPFYVKDGDLTITGGTFTQNVVDGIILWAKDGGKITVNGGDFSAIPDGEIAYVSTADALIEIYGGKFVMADKADGSKGDVLNVAQTLGLNKTDYIKVYGGSFSKDPAEGDDALGPTFVANGYASVKQDNGLWKVGAAIIATFKVDDAIVKAETNIVAFTPVAPTNPSKEGYTFTGWTPAVDEISKSTVFVAQFKAEETKVDPEQPIPVPAEKTPEQVAEQMNTKGIANYLKVPTVVTDAAAYTAMFAAKADGNTVIIALKPTVEAEIKAELANTATSGSMLNPDATTSEVTITARPGLFYGIKAVGDVTTIGTANGQNWVQASGDTVNVVRPTVSGNAAFFQAVCSPKAPPANN